MFAGEEERSGSAKAKHGKLTMLCLGQRTRKGPEGYYFSHGFYDDKRTVNELAWNMGCGAFDGYQPITASVAAIRPGM